jgi:septal ring factor EnvC (AmiA/AmiB activator)
LIQTLRHPGILAFLLLLLVWPTYSYGQSKKDLEDKRKKLIRDIQVTDKLLKKTTQNKEAVYDRYLALQNQIESRESLIQTIGEEVTAADEAIARNTGVVQSLSQDIERMQEEYGRMVRNAYRRKTISNPLLYILSADDLNQAFRRWLFLRKYDQYRKQQADAIASTRAMLSRRIAELEKTRTEKANLLNAIQSQKTILTLSLSDKEVLLKTLQKDESRLKQDLQKKQQAHESLNQAIENIIQEEVRKRIEESRKVKPPPPPPPAPAPAKPQEKVNAAPVAAAPKEDRPPPSAPVAEAIPDDHLSQFFRQRRGKLPWPVDNGFISRAYGRQKHPTIKNIEISNNGIDILTEESSEVHAICDGRVAGVQYIPGHDYTVILQHGTYYTVYSNLSETNLAKGNQVKSKQTIGKVSTNPITGSSELHFELWLEKERLNPAAWIRR